MSWTFTTGVSRLDTPAVGDTPAVYTIDYYTFEWGRKEDGGAPMHMFWVQPPRLVIRPLLGSIYNGNNDAMVDVARVGFEAATMTGNVYVEAEADALALRSLNGTQGVLSDGDGHSWNVVMVIDLAKFVGATTYNGTPTFAYSGTATFTRLSTITETPQS